MIHLSDIHKSYGAVRANQGASLDVAAGEIHALVGENGAGKTTLMRILGGMLAPDTGRVEVNGRDVTGWRAADAITAGVGMVHQHFMLVPTMTVTENLTLGAERTRAGQLDRRRADREVRDLMERTGLAVDPDRRVAELNVGEAQRVEILRTLYRGARVLILDEPTAVLSPGEIAKLWRVLRQLRDMGTTCVIITHRLDEVMAISDAMTVMRHGETVGRLRTSETTTAEIARLMIGRDVVPAGHAAAKPAAEAPRPLLSVRGLTVPGGRGTDAVVNVSFEVATGEILGIAGVDGNGQTELIEAIAGLRRTSAGVIMLDGRDANPLSVRERSDAGLAHIPEDRQGRGLVLDYSTAENLILGRQHRFTHHGVLDVARVTEHAHHLISTFDIRPDDPAAPARALSGGNQQKVVIAREMGGSSGFTVLLAAQPTRGLDAGAIEFVHARLRDARAAGKAVVLVSADLAELLALCDRIAVMYGGSFVTVVNGATVTAEQLGPFMTGAERAA